MKPRYDNLAALGFLCGLTAYVLSCALSPISWSPDGRWIALTRYLGQEKEGSPEPEVTASELWIVSPSPIERRGLVRTSGSLLSAPAWAPDGKSLFVTEFVEGVSSGSTGLRRVDVLVNGKPEQLVAEEPTSSDSITLWQVGLDGKTTRIHHFPGSGDAESALLVSPSPSPGGDRVAFVASDSAVVLVRSDGKLERVIELEKPNDLSWSPDGKWLTVTRAGADEGEGPRVHFLDPKASETFTLDSSYFGAVWLPGGEHVLALRKHEGGQGKTYSVSQIRIKGGVREIASRAVDIDGGDPYLLEPRGHSLFLARGQEDERPAAIVHLDLRTGKSKVLYESFAAAVPRAISPDGRWLAFREGAPGDDVSIESVVGVLDLKATTEPLYLAVEDKQWAAVLDGYVEEFADAKPDEIEPAARALAALVLRRLEGYIAAFRRDFPASPLLPRYAAAVKDLRAKLRQAGIGIGPGGGLPQW